MKISLASRCCHTHPFVLAFHQASPFARALQRPSLFSPSLLFLSEDHSLSLSQRLARTRPTHPSRALEQSPARASPLKEQEIRLFFFFAPPVVEKHSNSPPFLPLPRPPVRPSSPQVRPKFAQDGSLSPLSISRARSSSRQRRQTLGESERREKRLCRRRVKQQRATAAATEKSTSILGASSPSKNLLRPRSARVSNPRP